jgi:hypothetical protein
VAVRDAAITGMAADGGVLAFTFAQFAGSDDLDRPLLAHDYVRIDLDAGQVTAPVNVPGYVVAAFGPEVFTVEDVWGDDWSVTSTVVAARTDSGDVEVRERLELPQGAYDLRSAGRTLYFTTGEGFVVPLFDGLGRPEHLLPESDIGSVSLGSALALGPIVSGAGSFRTLLLPEDGTALVSRDGLTVEHWDFTHATAELSWSVTIPAYPLRAHADTLNPGQYLLAAGYAGDLTLP